MSRATPDAAHPGHRPPPPDVAARRPMTRTRSLWRPAFVGVVGTLVAGAASCGGSTDPGATPVEAVALSDTALVLRLGDEAALVARASRANGDELVGRRIFWSSRDPAVVDVSQSGVVRALTVGTTEVAASVEGQGALARVTVLARPITTVQIDPATLQLVVGARQRLAARTLNDAAAPAAAAVTWTSLNPEVVSVSADGEVTALAPGAGSVRATAEGASATAAIVVSPVPVASVAIAPGSPSLVAGSTLQLTATPADAAGAPLSGREVSWSSRDPGIALISSSGQVTGIAAGTATIAATVEGRSATTTVTVRPVPVASVTISPGASSVGIGGTLRLGAVVADAAGNALAGRAVTFTSSAANVAGVDADGLVTAKAVGTATITGTSEGVTGSATVSVIATGAVASVSVAPSTATLTVGGTRTFSATARAADGAPVAGRAVTWSSGGPSVLSVSPAGVVTAVAPGTAQVLARVDGITGTATITVQRVPVASVQVAPSPANVAAGSFVQLGATPRDGAGTALADRAVTWRSDNLAVATVTSDGRVLGVAPGSTVVRATSEGVTGSTTVNVAAVVRVAPSQVTVRDRGNNRTAQLVATDHTNRVIPIGEVTWRSSNPGIATVDERGLVRGISSGSQTATAEIIATYRGATAKATVTVTR